MQELNIPDVNLLRALCELAKLKSDLLTQGALHETERQNLPWSKLQKPVVTAFDVDSRCGLLTDAIFYQGKPMVGLVADQSFPY